MLSSFQWYKNIKGQHSLFTKNQYQSILYIDLNSNPLI